MSSEITSGNGSSSATTNDHPQNAAADVKGKGKNSAVAEDEAMDDDDDEEDDEEDDDEDDEDEDDMDEDNNDDIDPTAIRSRRTRGVRVDYTSKEALEKAGLKPEDADADEDEGDFSMRDD